MAGLYLHIPFCRQACYYCDFHFSTDTHHRAEMFAAMRREIQLQQGYLNDPALQSVYYGGGTPSLVQGEELHQFHETIGRQYRLAPGAECTLEANPDDLSAAHLKTLKEAGINRLSIGIQSFDDAVLTFMHRAHNAREGLDAVARARQAGFENLSIDLIYGIPGESDEKWRRTIQQALALKPEHLSAYALTIEERTVFGHRLKKGDLQPTEEDAVARQFEMLMDEMEGAGYNHYEISNFALPGREAVHNSNYWRQEAYLGIGPSAHSYNTVSRQFNVRNNAQYTQRIARDEVPCDIEILSRENQINEHILTSLRTAWGVDLGLLRTQHQDDLLRRAARELDSFLSMGLVLLAGDRLTLTRKGKVLADRISSDLMIDPAVG